MKLNVNLSNRHRKKHHRSFSSQNNWMIFEKIWVNMCMNMNQKCENLSRGSPIWKTKCTLLACTAWRRLAAHLSPTVLHFLAKIRPNLRLPASMISPAASESSAARPMCPKPIIATSLPIWTAPIQICRGAIISSSSRAPRWVLRRRCLPVAKLQAILFPFHTARMKFAELLQLALEFSSHLLPTARDLPNSEERWRKL